MCLPVIMLKIVIMICAIIEFLIGIATILLAFYLIFFDLLFIIFISIGVIEILTSTCGFVGAIIRSKCLIGNINSQLKLILLKK